MSKDVAVVAGAAGDLGRAISLALSKSGYDVIGLSRSEVKDSNLKHQFTVDLSNRDDLQTIVKQITRQSIGAKVKLVVNAAGSYKKTLEESFDELTYKNNVTVAENILFLFTDLCKAEHGARIVTISSIDAIFPNINSFSYSVSKAAVRTLVQLYRKRYRDADINYDLILPGAIHSKMRADKQENKEMLVQLQDVANTCVYLAKLGRSVRTDDIILYPKSFIFSN